MAAKKKTAATDNSRPATDAKEPPKTSSRATKAGGKQAAKEAKTAPAGTRTGGLGLMLGCMLVAAFLALSVRTFGFTLVIVRSDAMGETLQRGDIVLLSRVAQPEAGNIVLAGARNGSVFRRVAGEPGDTVWAQDGAIWRNGLPLYEPYAIGEAQWDIPETLLEENVYLLAADDRSWESVLVERGGIAGTVRAVIWPLSRAGFF